MVPKRQSVTTSSSKTPDVDHDFPPVADCLDIVLAKALLLFSLLLVEFLVREAGLHLGRTDDGDMVEWFEGPIVIV